MDRTDDICQHSLRIQRCALLCPRYATTGEAVVPLYCLVVVVVCVWGGWERASCHSHARRRVNHHHLKKHRQKKTK